MQNFWDSTTLEVSNFLKFRNLKVSHCVRISFRSLRGNRWYENSTFRDPGSWRFSSWRENFQIWRLGKSRCFLGLWSFSKLKEYKIWRFWRYTDWKISVTPKARKTLSFVRFLTCNYVINRRKAISHSYTDFPTFSIICVRCEIYCSMLKKFPSSIVGRFILCLNVRTHACVSHVQSMLIRN